MVREVRYDEVFDAKAFPVAAGQHGASGKDQYARSRCRLEVPGGLNAASALIAFVLMDADSTFEVVGMGGARRTIWPPTRMRGAWKSGTHISSLLMEARPLNSLTMPTAERCSIPILPRP